MKEIFFLRLHLFLKRIKDLKIKVKIRILLFGLTIATTLGIGMYSYQVARNELIYNSKVSVTSLEKQSGRNLDDKINSFKDVSYQILQSSKINSLLQYTKEEALKRKVLNEGLPAVIFQHAFLSNYTMFALLRPNNGVIYEYFKYGEEKLSLKDEENLMDILYSRVNRSKPICWTEYNGNVYFVRLIIDSELREKGMICFSVTEDFFELIETDVDYLSNDNVMILNGEQELLKWDNHDIEKDLIQKLTNYNESKFYTYNMTLDIGKDTYTVIVMNTLKNDWTILCFFSHSVLLRGIDKIFGAMMEVIAVAILLILIITAIISNTITKNVNLIEQGMKHYEQGHFEYRISPASYDEIGLLGLQLNYMAVKIDNLILILQKEQDEKQELEFQTLQSQINPHFLYNTLGSLKWLAFQKGEKEIATSIDALTNLLRFTIKKAGEMVPVTDEIEYIKNYIAVEKMRYGDQFSIQFDIESDVENELIPGFILQPIVENSLLHGLDLANKNGIIVVKGYKKTNYLCLEIIDNGVGMEQEMAARLLEDSSKQSPYKGFSSIGLRIVHKRLHEIYGEDYFTDIVSEIGKGTGIILNIPLQEREPV